MNRGRFSEPISDEMAQEIEEAFNEFECGFITVDELRQLVGQDAAAQHLEGIQEYMDSVDALFDDPEML